MVVNKYTNTNILIIVLLFQGISLTTCLSFLISGVFGLIE